VYAGVAVLLGAGCSGTDGGTATTCAPAKIDELHMALQYAASSGDSGNSSTASWPSTSVSFPVTIRLDVGASRTSGNSEISVPVMHADALAQSSSVCAVTGGPTCGAGRCTFDVTMSSYGICMLRIDATLEDGTRLGTCWHKAIFADVATMDSDQAAIDAALSRCRECAG
jgi:hypothetical protein